jgi:hypothetical protein
MQVAKAMTFLAIIAVDVSPFWIQPDAVPILNPTGKEEMAEGNRLDELDGLLRGHFVPDAEHRTAIASYLT